MKEDSIMLLSSTSSVGKIFGFNGRRKAGIQIETVSAYDIKRLGLEFKPTDQRFQAFLEMVSWEAKAKNVAEAEEILRSEGKEATEKNLRKVLLRMGRDPNHYSSPHVDGASELCHDAKTGAAGFKALIIFYLWYEFFLPLLDEGSDDPVARKWIGKMQNRQAVTNRKKMVVDELVKAILATPKDETVRIFSLAGGDCQVVIEAVLQAGRKVEILLVDPDREALSQALKNAKEAGLESCFRALRGLASKARRMAVEFKPHVFDLVGLLDYFNDDEVIEVISLAWESLCEGGTLVTGNISDNKERIFLEGVLLWFMIYREPEKLGGLIVEGGFLANNVKIIREPLNIHSIAVCRKT